MSDYLHLSEKYNAVKNSIDLKCKLNGRDPNSVKLMLVTKTISPELIRESYDLGHRLFGENKIQELVQKSRILNDIPIQFSFIGHLQTNKVKDCLKYASSIHSLDRLNLVQALDTNLLSLGKSIDVLVQVNTSGESSKYGVAPENLVGLLREISKYDTIKVKGLMTLAIFSEEEVKVRKCFQLLRNLQKQVKFESIPGIEMSELSMGMSSDYELAIEEGSTIIRIGTGIFGRRSKIKE